MPKRREHPRVEYLATVQLRPEAEWIECDATDLSFGGLFVALDQPPPLRSEVNLLLDFATEADPIEVVGMVVRHEPARGGVGIAFIRMQQETNKRLRDLLQEPGSEARSS